MKKYKTNKQPGAFAQLLVVLRRRVSSQLSRVLHLPEIVVQQLPQLLRGLQRFFELQPRFGHVRRKLPFAAESIKLHKIISRAF